MLHATLTADKRLGTPRYMNPDDTAEAHDSSDDDNSRHRQSERTISEFIKKLVDAGVGRLPERSENLRQFVHDLKLPKEVGSYLLSQIDETKNGLYRVVARELRDFLEHTNLADELTRALTKLAFEVKMEIRFKPNEVNATSLPKPHIESDVKIRTDTQPPASSSNTTSTPPPKKRH